MRVAGFGAAVSAGQFNVFTDTLPHGSRSGVISFALGCGNSIPVYGPPDEQGTMTCSNTPAFWRFSRRWRPLPPSSWAACASPAAAATPKLTHGYLDPGRRAALAYLTDTVGLPPATADYLQNVALDLLVLDCSLPPQPQAPRNHNDLTRAQETQRLSCSPNALLTHISHHRSVAAGQRAAHRAGAGVRHLSVSLGSSAADPTPAP